MANDKKRREPESIIEELITEKKSFKMSLKRQRFVDEYLVDLNARRSYMAAGFTQNENSAGAGAYKLLREPAIQRALQKSIEERKRRTHVDQDKVVKELAKIAFANIKDVVKHWGANDVTLYDSGEIKDDVAAAISEISTSTNLYGMDVRVKMYDKRAALVDLGNHLGIFEKKEAPKDPVEEARKICSLVGEMMGTMGGASNATAG